MSALGKRIIKEASECAIVLVVIFAMMGPFWFLSAGLMLMLPVDTGAAVVLGMALSVAELGLLGHFSESGFRWYVDNVVGRLVPAKLRWALEDPEEGGPQ